jgi:hypothetical protein
MNTIEQSHVEREEIKGIQFGVVVGIDDPEDVGRVKVRVRGVFEEPIRKKDIPWALPLISSAVPSLGDEVCVIFENDDLERPRYFPKTDLDKAQIKERKRVFSAILEKKRQSVFESTLVVTQTIDEPVDESDGNITKDKKVVIYPEDVATETEDGFDSGVPETGIMVKVNREKGKESVSVFHPKGTFIDIRSNGDVVIHGVRDIVTVSEGDSKGVVKGCKLLRVKGSLELKVDGGIKIKTDTTFEIEAPSVKVTGGEVEINGTVAPTGTGPFNAIPACLFTGAPHSGNKVVGT